MNLGLVGWRGMVGSVLVERMLEEQDFKYCDPYLFSTSQVGEASPFGWSKNEQLLDGFDLETLSRMDALIVTQGSDYTQKVYQALMDTGWAGYWIDAASHLRMHDNARIVLDPINGESLKQSLLQGVRTFVGGNCTVSLMLLALDGLVKKGLIKWIVPMTYQAASGAGAEKMSELIQQMGTFFQIQQAHSKDSILAIEQRIAEAMRDPERCPQQAFGVPLAGSLIPWIDAEAAPGFTKEEWKAEVETNKILQGVKSWADNEQNLAPIGVDGLCVRIGTLRCHSQALTLKLTQDLTESEVADCLKEANPWVRYIENTPDASMHALTPAAVSGRLDIAVGRLRKLRLESNLFSLFTVGDQLLWGAAEPLRRAFRLILTDK